MQQQRLRADLFALARQIDTAADEVTLINWTDPPRTPPVTIDLRQNQVLNLFLTPSSMSEAAQRAGMDESDLAPGVVTLQEKGLLRTEDEWQALRERHPYTVLPSLWDGADAGAEQYASYEDAYAHDYVPWNDLPVAADLLAMGPLPGNGLRVLDVGCGSGHNLPLMRALGFHCSGIDISETAIAKLRALSDNPDDFVVGSVTDLPWPDGSFEFVTDIGCLHCLQPQEVRDYVAEVGRVLSPGGRFLCRAFKPRDDRVVQAQPVKMDRIGYAPEEVAEMFDGVLPVMLVKEGPVHGFYLATR